MSIVQEIMKLREMDLPRLLERYRQVMGKEPTSTSREFLAREIGWKLQADHTAHAAGKTTISPRAEIKFTIAKPGKTESLRRRKPGELPAGSAITRRWRGRDIRLRVLDSGYEVDGIVYLSLSAAATGVTGAHWSGRLFWQLRKRGKK
jgi:hypothetical protein